MYYIPAEAVAATKAATAAATAVASPSRCHTGDGGGEP